MKSADCRLQQTETRMQVSVSFVILDSYCREALKGSHSHPSQECQDYQTYQIQPGIWYILYLVYLVSGIWYRLSRITNPSLIILIVTVTITDSISSLLQAQPLPLPLTLVHLLSRHVVPQKDDQRVRRAQSKLSQG